MVSIPDTTENATTSLRLITVDEYYRMADLGILKPNEQLELISGQIIRKMTPQGSPHAAAISRANRLMFGHTLPNALIRIQLPLTLSKISEPEPDIAVVKFDANDYDKAHPRADDVYLVIEVSDSSLDYDLSVKNRLYAQANIQEYWVLNLGDRQLHRLLQPSATGYQNITILNEKDSLAPIAFPDIKFQVNQLLKPNQ